MDYKTELERMTERRDKLEKKARLYEGLPATLYGKEIEILQKCISYLDAKIERLSLAKN